MVRGRYDNCPDTGSGFLPTQKVYPKRDGFGDVTARDAYLICCLCLVLHPPNRLPNVKSSLGDFSKTRYPKELSR